MLYYTESYINSSWKGHEIIDHPIEGGAQQIAKVLSYIHHPLFPKKMLAPFPRLLP